MDNEDEFYDEELKDLTLTHHEAIYLDDSLTMMLEREGDNFITMRPLLATANVPAPVNLIEKIGKAILFTNDVSNAGEDAVVSLNDGDLYLLREVALSYVKIGDEAVGYNLKCKIYGLLYGHEYQQDKQVDALLDTVPISDSIQTQSQS